jgi:(1->4)-alpha-D-glucan 1-alpha-D-glucosylmutase
VQNIEDGQIKLFVVEKLLHLRNSMSSLFANGVYKPVVIEGSHANNVIAFMRDDKVLVAVGRFFTQLGKTFVGEETWKDTSLKLNLDKPTEFENVLTGKRTIVAGTVFAKDLFGQLPFCILKIDIERK